MENARIRGFQNFLVGRVENHRFAEGKRGTNLDMSSVAARKHHDNYVCSGYGSQFRFR